MLVTKKSNPHRPCRVLIYGREGVGKSTFGAKADSPVFITPEGGTDQLTNMHGGPVDEMPNVSTFDGVKKAVKDLITQPHDFKTLTLDSADWIEKVCHAKIIGNSNKDIIRVNGGYSAGLRESEALHRELIADLSELRDKKGMNIIVTAHAQVKDVKDPEMMSDYDGYQIKCDERVSSLWREWVDAMFFVRFATFIKISEETAKARALGDDTRTVYTIQRPAFQAKNRYGMPPQMSFTENFWSEFQGYVKKGPVEIPVNVTDVYREIISLVSLVPSEETQKKIMEQVQKEENNLPKLLMIKKRVSEITNQKVV